MGQRFEFCESVIKPGLDWESVVGVDVVLDQLRGVLLVVHPRKQELHLLLDLEELLDPLRYHLPLYVLLEQVLPHPDDLFDRDVLMPLLPGQR